MPRSRLPSLSPPRPQFLAYLSCYTPPFHESLIALLWLNNSSGHPRTNRTSIPSHTFLRDGLLSWGSDRHSRRHWTEECRNELARGRARIISVGQVRTRVVLERLPSRVRTRVKVGPIIYSIVNNKNEAIPNVLVHTLLSTPRCRYLLLLL
jgi:hypothetical protein